MKIGDLARRANVNVQTIRFYEREGLLPEPGRTTSGYRSYQRDDLERVVIIKRFQGLGFTLAEIAEVFDMHQTLAATRHDPQHRSAARSEMLEKAQDRLSIIDEKLSTLQSMKAEMVRLIEELAGEGEPICIARPRQSGACERA